MTLFFSRGPSAGASGGNVSRPATAPKSRPVIMVVYSRFYRVFYLSTSSATNIGETTLRNGKTFLSLFLNGSIPGTPRRISTIDLAQHQYDLLRFDVNISISFISIQIVDYPPKLLIGTFSSTLYFWFSPGVLLR